MIANANARYERVLSTSQHVLIEALELLRLELVREQHTPRATRRRRAGRASRT